MYKGLNGLFTLVEEVIEGAAPGLGWEGKYKTVREVKITILLYTDYIQTNCPLRKQQFLAFPRAPRRI